jgi:4-hydroxybenzoate polyprenyltransferase
VVCCLIKASLAPLAFTLIASAGYIFNDWLDKKSDAKHPQKKNRPLASGSVTDPQAWIFLVVLLCVGLGLAYQISPINGVLLASYAALTAAYSLKLKSIPWLEMLCIVMGFMLRILSGTLGIGIAPSGWILSCGFLLSSFLILAKRDSEQQLSYANYVPLRNVLLHYDKGLMHNLVYVSAVLCFLVYIIYAIHHQVGLTIIFVGLGLLRYLWCLRRCGTQGIEIDVSNTFFNDRVLQCMVLLWLLFIVL